MKQTFVHGFYFALQGLQKYFYCWFESLHLLNTVKSRAVDQSTMYSIFEHFGGATNQDLLQLPCTAINQIDHPKFCIKGCTNDVM